MFNRAAEMQLVCDDGELVKLAEADVQSEKYIKHTRIIYWMN